jgi:hypothetical protein
MNSQLLKRYSLVAIGLFYAPTFLMAQSLQGLWLVQEVSIGDQIVTPQERWFRYDGNGKFTSGNGWLQHSSGTYTYEESDSSFLPVEDYGTEDPYGAFKLWFEGETMIWKRYEDDMLVMVKLNRTDALPRSLQDELKGRWQLDSVIFAERDLPDQKSGEPSEQLFLRWDREYRVFVQNQSTKRGYWHLHSRRPELTLISRSEEDTFKVFEVLQEGESLIMKNKDQNTLETTRYYHRVRELDTP